MSNISKVRLAAVVVAAAVPAITIASCQSGSSAPTPMPTPTIAVEPTATPVPRLNGQDPLESGRYQVNASLSPAPTEVAVPHSWLEHRRRLGTGRSGYRPGQRRHHPVLYDPESRGRSALPRRGSTPRSALRSTTSRRPSSRTQPGRQLNPPTSGLMAVPGNSSRS